MNLRNKKELAAKTLGVGKNKIKFNTEGLSEIKEAITKEDIKTLYAEGIITIKQGRGRKKIVRRKIRRGPGKIKKKIKTRKQDYVKITRKLRKYVKQLRAEGTIDRERYIELRKKIRMRNFKSKANLREHVEGLGKNVQKKKEEKSDKKLIKKNKKE